jgi:hypothetical protein
VAAIEVEGLEKSYPTDVRALDGLAFRVEGACRRTLKGAGS